MADCPPTPVTIVSRADVAYPDSAREAHLEGTALLKIEVDAAGKPTRVTVQKSAGAGVLDQAATKAGRDSTYKPATDACKPVVVDLRP